MRRLAVAAAVAACLAAPTLAPAATITAGPSPSVYQNPNITIAAGESVTFQNLDFSAAHDVTSTDVGPGATALFRSETISAPGEAPVVGAETLKAGKYDFICSIHSFMTGSITVSGGGGGGDNSPPNFSLSSPDRKLSKVAKAGAIKVQAKINEAATLRATASAAGGGPTLAKGKAQVEKGRATVSAKLTAKGKRAVAKAKKLKLEIDVKATDAAANAQTETLELTLR